MSATDGESVRAEGVHRLSRRLASTTRAGSRAASAMALERLVAARA